MLTDDDILWEWDRSGQDLFMLRYRPKRWRHATAATDLVLDFKDGDSGALEVCAEILRDGLLSIAQKHPTTRIYLVPVPGHEVSSGDSPCHRAAQILEDRAANPGPQVWDWSGRLSRCADIRKASKSLGNRPTEEEHYVTLCYSGGVMTERDVVVLLDDVYTSGATARACRRVLYENTRSSRIVGLFLSKTS